MLITKRIRGEKSSVQRSCEKKIVFRYEPTLHEIYTQFHDVVRMNKIYAFRSIGRAWRDTKRLKRAFTAGEQRKKISINETKFPAVALTERLTSNWRPVLRSDSKKKSHHDQNEDNDAAFYLVTNNITNFFLDKLKKMFIRINFRQKIVTQMIDCGRRLCATFFHNFQQDSSR